MSLKALCLIIIGPRGVPWQVEGTAAASIGENQWNTQPHNSLVGLSAIHLSAEGCGQLRAQELAADVVFAGTLHKVDVIREVVRPAAEI